jgi:enamine deaminase RidA (YjgF/YER057c/UK114 family)
MNADLLQEAVNTIKDDLENAIRTGQCLGKRYENGQRAKEALIRSQRLIMRLHEVTKVSVSAALQRHSMAHRVHPPIGQSSPELRITGFIKAKQQDVVFVIGEGALCPEIIADGPLAGETDLVGRDVSEHAIVIGIRSQMSSVAKNFDTLMERAFAETLNLRLRLPKLVMAEVYLLPVAEYDDAAMKRNQVTFKSAAVPVVKFIRTFLGISGRNNRNLNSSLYKYDRSCLLLVDCRCNPARVFYTLDELKEERIVPASFEADFGKLSPRGLSEDLVNAYRERHSFTS